MASILQVICVLLLAISISRVECVKQGDTHESNKVLQIHLRDIGLYTGAIDGNWKGTSNSGVETTRALQTLLQKRGYFFDNRGRDAVVDGDFGPITCTCLQKFLVSRGYLDTSGVSGKMDPMTCTAIDKFVTDQDCMYGTAGISYTGMTAMTDTGKPCANWTLYTYPAEDFPDATLEDAGNYCRNPNWDPKGPWCRSSDFGGWQTCAIPKCKLSLKCQQGTFTDEHLEEKMSGLGGNVLKIKYGYTHLYECEEDCMKEQRENWPCTLVEFNPDKKKCVLASASKPTDTGRYPNDAAEYYSCYIPLPATTTTTTTTTTPPTTTAGSIGEDNNNNNFWNDIFGNGAGSNTVTSTTVMMIAVHVIALVTTLCY